MSRIRRVVPPIRWSTITASVTQGQANQTIKLASFLQNPQNRTVSYSVIAGTLPAGLTLNASTGVIVYDGTSPVAAASVQFRATTGTFSVESALVTVSIGTNAGTQPGSLNVTLGLTNGGAGKPWTFGHAFKKGDVPTGSFIIGTGPSEFQADIRNRWADGSVRFAVLSGIGGTSCVITSATAPLNSGSTTVSEPSAAAVSGYTITLTGDGAGTYTIPVGAQTTWARGTASKVRQILGTVMSEFHYYQPTSDTHLALWFYVRAYNNGAIEVEVSVENGWTEVAGPGQRNYTVTVSAAGAAVPFSDGVAAKSVSHLHHTRWSRVDWITTDPLIVPRHDVKYFMSTRLTFAYDVDRFPFPVASYGKLPAATMAAGLRPPPFSICDGVGLAGSTLWGGTGMGGGGWAEYIGPMPLWDAAYFTSSAAETGVASVLKSGRSTGNYGIHYKSEFTGRPPMASENNWNRMTLSGCSPGFSDKVMQVGADNGPSAGGRNSPTPTGSDPVRYSISHAPCHQMPYLLTGRWPYLENMANEMTSMQLAIGLQYGWATGTDPYPVTFGLRRIDTKHNTHMSRSAGWGGMRNYALASTLWPQTLNGQALSAPDQAIKAYLVSIFEFQLTFMHDTYVLGVGPLTQALSVATSVSGSARRKSPLGAYNDNVNNSYGLIQPFSYPPYSYDSTFMNFIIGYCSGFAHITEPDISTAAKAKLSALYDYGMIHAEGLLGGNEYNWRYAAIYLIPGSKNFVDFTTFTDQWNEIKAILALTDDARDEGLFVYANQENPTGIMADGLAWSNAGFHGYQMQMPGAVLAKMRGTTAGATAYRRMTTSSTFLSAKEQNAIKSNPIFGALIPWS